MLGPAVCLDVAGAGTATAFGVVVLEPFVVVGVAAGLASFFLKRALSLSIVADGVRWCWMRERVSARRRGRDVELRAHGMFG